MIGIKLTPLDSLFFRDSTPFASGSSSQVEVGGIFPPHPTTITGSIRAALARANGWSTGQERWPERLNSVLGNGPNDLGLLRLKGPFLLYKNEPVFRVPRNILGIVEKDGFWEPIVTLSPGDPIECDLGKSVRLPSYDHVDLAENKLRFGTDTWLTVMGMNRVLNGSIPSRRREELLQSSDLWASERRIGIELDAAKRTAKEGMLYGSIHIRLLEDVAIGIFVDGVPDTWEIPFGELILLGGEGRLAYLEKWEYTLPLQEIGMNLESSRNILVVTLTPLDIEKEIVKGDDKISGQTSLKIISGCLDRPMRIGGWDSLARKPLPTRSVLRPGSVFFCTKLDGHSLIDTTLSQGSQPSIGLRQEWGFGVVALGVWNEGTEVVR